MSKQKSMNDWKEEELEGKYAPRCQSLQSITGTRIETDG